MSKRLKIWLYACIAGFVLGMTLLLGTVGAQAATDTDANDKQPTQTVSATVSDPLSNYLAPGGLITVSIGGIFLIVREIKATKAIDLQAAKDRADNAETKALVESTKLSAQVTRLESKLDDALKETEAKHDLYMAEIAHRRRLELILAEHGISLPAN